jgi:hypothetical protein
MANVSSPEYTENPTFEQKLKILPGTGRIKKRSIFPVGEGWRIYVN